jgi:hypothetical protein
MTLQYRNHTQQNTAINAYGKIPRKLYVSVKTVLLLVKIVLDRGKLCRTGECEITQSLLQWSRAQGRPQDTFQAEIEAKFV